MLPLYGMGDSGTCEDGMCTGCGVMGMPSGGMGIGAPQLATMPPTDPAVSLPLRPLSCGALPLFWLYFPPTQSALPAFAAAAS